MIYIVAVIIFLLSYMWGCFSTARIVAKSARSLNIQKVGNGLADTENIYNNVSKPLGVLVGILDVVKSYILLWLLELILSRFNSFGIPPDISFLYSENILLFYGIGMLVGHCLPLTHHLRGGRGIFTYMGILLYFVPIPTLITGIIVIIIVIFFHQIRFAQYAVVILPVILAQLMSSFLPLICKPHSQYFISILLGQAILMGLLNIIVSKKLGEF